MKHLIAIVFAALSLTVGNAYAATQTIKAQVNGMVCAFCAQGIEKKMLSLSQTKEVYVDLKNGVVAVELKEGQTLTHDAVKGVITDAGYEVAKIQTVPETAKQIRAAAQAKK